MSLRYTTWQYGELLWVYKTCTFKNHANLLAYLANWQLYTLESSFPDTITHQGTHFLGFVQIFSALIVKKNCQNGLLLKCSCVCCWLLNYMHGHIDDPPCSISTLYITRVINYSRPTMVPLLFHTASNKRWVRPGDEVSTICWYDCLIATIAYNFKVHMIQIDHCWNVMNWT